MRQLAQFSEQLGTLIPRVRTPSFPAGLIALLKNLVSANDATIVQYPGRALPVIEYFETDEKGDSNLGLYTCGAFLLDPYYQAAENHDKRGFFCLSDLAPEAFSDSEYYRTYYQHADYEDECGYLVSTAGEGFVNISMARYRDTEPFADKHLQLLDDIWPVIEQLCKQHWCATNHSNQDLRGQLGAALQAFGSSALTDRETQVINLVLHGHSTKSVAEKLSISMETVKLHRKHAYAKLEVGSQAELFYLFLDSLMSAGDYRGGDPLTHYLQKPQQT